MQPSPATNRKRPCKPSRPGSWPSPHMNTPQPTYQYQQQPLENAPDFGNFDFSGTIPPEQNYADPSTFDNSSNNNQLSYTFNNQQPQADDSLAPVPSTELVRRTRNQQILPQAGGQESWGGNGHTGNLTGSAEEENEQMLDAKVALAKKDAQGKRKQIPPFVQKLSSFLDSGNTDLIRWSDDGRSFIVLDEDEFARTLIPELFKHNNYASFVRQLNMYGFHKTVNITDGSLRQSEKARKGVKPPSMYSHPYFRRNRPDLLWLIQKPISKSSAKRKRDGTIKEQDESDDERQFSPAPGPRPHELSSLRSNQDLAQVPRSDMSAVKQELQKLQTQQKFISQMITQLKEQNDQFYRQATAFQTLHDRHENSINAILTFLATVYNNSMDNPGAQNLVNMFSNHAQNQQHGSVVEEYNESTPTPSNQVQRYQKRPPLLLPAAPDVNAEHQGRISTAPNSARASASPPNGSSLRENAPSSTTQQSLFPRSAGTPSIKHETQSPNMPNQTPESGDSMLNFINSANATAAENASGTAAPAFDINNMVDQFTGGQPFTPQQQDFISTLRQHQGGGPDAALTSRASQGNLDLSELKNSRESLSSLQSLQREQEAQIQNLQSKLTPMSPTGNIPGLAGDSQLQEHFDNIGDPGNYDPESFLNFDDNNDFDFGFDTSNAAAGLNGGVADDGGGGDGAGQDMFANENGGLVPPDDGGVTDGAGRVESVSSSAPSPNAATAEEEVDTPRKRVRR